MLYKHPGPVGTSCLTCKRRRKKCDRGRPACERCRTGGFECLGYDHNDQGLPGSSLADSLRDSTGQGAKGSSAPSQGLSPLGFPEGADSAVENGRTMCSPFIPSSLEEQSSIPAAAPSITCATPTPHLNHHVAHVSHDGKRSSRFQHQSPPIVGSHELLLAWPGRPSDQTYSAARSFATVPEKPVAHSDSSQLVPLSLYPWQSAQLHREGYAHSIPRSLPPVSTDTANVINYVLAQYERLTALSYFKPAHYQVVRVRQSVSWRLQTSDTTRWVVYLGAKILDSVLEGILPEKTAAYDHWIQKFEHELHSTPTRALTNDEVQNRLCGALEIEFLKLKLNGNFHILHLLRSCAPIFLQIARSDPTLWPSESNFTTVSVAHILASNRYELGHYIHLDTFCAMAYAVPPTLGYDTSCPPFNTEIHPVEWMHGFPAEFHRAFIEINARCALNHVAPDWQDIERRIISWQPRHYNTTEDAWKVVVGLAVQESWRQVLLAYLYMAVCGVASDDPRVQSAIRQIFQLLGTVRRQDPPKVNVHFFMHYLIAGACTPSEKRRAFVRSRMLDKFENSLWLLHGADFVPVLDHLWHGAAANGRPIRWSDYMASRQTILPIPI